MTERSNPNQLELQWPTKARPLLAPATSRKRDPAFDVGLSPGACFSADGTATERFLSERSSTEPSGSLVEPAAQRTSRVCRGLRAALRDRAPSDLVLAEALVGLAIDLSAREREILVALVLAALISHRRGDTRLPCEGPDGESALRSTLSTLFADDTARELGREISRLLSAGLGAPILGRDPEGYTPLVLVGGQLYIQKMLSLERRLGDALAVRLARDIPPKEGLACGHSQDAIEAALADVVARPAVVHGTPILLNSEQQAAIRLAVTRTFGVISGGPGTGKTSVAVGMLRVWSRLGASPRSIALAAPTGKAAHRLTQSVTSALKAVASPSRDDDRLAERRIEAETLHRLLGFDPSSGRFRHHENSPLAVEAVLVDESSMIDLSLMDQLLRAVPMGARLILLGDRDQLPSVEAGAILRDLDRLSRLDCAPNLDCALNLDCAPNLDRRDNLDRTIDIDRRRDPGASEDSPGGPHAPSNPFTVSLLHSHRVDALEASGRRLFSAARAIRAGDADRLLADSSDNVTSNHAPVEHLRCSDAGEGGPIFEVHGATSSVRFEGPELLDLTGAPGGAERSLDALLERWIEDNGLLKHAGDEAARHVFRFRSGHVLQEDEPALLEWLERIDRFKILCVTRSEAMAMGAAALNARIHQQIRHRIDPTSRDRFVAGEPVIMLRNDYDRGLFNGDTGVVLPVSVDEHEATLMAVFRTPAGLKAHALGLLAGDLEHAHALTIHKAQGSEYDRVLLMLPSEDNPLLTRELLYTGVTRSRRGVVICGDPRLLAAGIRRRFERHSGLAERIRVRLDDLARDGAAVDAPALGGSAIEGPVVHGPAIEGPAGDGPVGGT